MSSRLESNRSMLWIILWIFLMAAIPSFAWAQEYNNPESVAYDSVNGRYSVSNYGDGSIIQIDREGAASYFATDLGRCVGLHILNNTLYVNRAEFGMKGYDLSTDESIVDLTIPGLQFLNDITSDGVEYLYVTDWHPGGCEIYRISIADYSVSTFLEGGFSYTNGILYDGRHNRLLTVGYVGSDYSRDYIISIDLDDPAITETFDPGVRGLDGLTIDNDGNIYVSAWAPDAVYRYRGGELDGSPELVSSGHPDPADIFFDKHNNVLAVPNFSEQSVDFLALQFSPTPTGEIVTDEFESYGIAWADYDNDGDQDLFVANCPSNQGNRDFLYHNNGDGTFTGMTDGVVVTDGGASYGAAWGDYDRDGDLDLFVARMGNDDEDNALYHNNGTLNSWITITCQGTLSNATAVGAKVRVEAAVMDGPIWQMREISAQTGYCGQNSLSAHFGLGSATLVDSITVEWPSGQVDVLTDVDVDQFLIIREGETVGSDDSPEGATSPERLGLSRRYPNPFDKQTTIEFELPAPSEVTLAVFNVKGNVVRVLIPGRMLAPGQHTIVWDGRGDDGNAMSSGKYFYRIKAGDVVEIQPMLRLRGLGSHP